MSQSFRALPIISKATKDQDVKYKTKEFKGLHGGYVDAEQHKGPTRARGIHSRGQGQGQEGEPTKGQ